MAGTNETPMLPFAGEVADLLQPLGAAEVVQNFVRTRDRTLGPVRGPAPILPDYGSGYPSYGTPHGVFHCRLIGGRRDVTLWHEGTSIRVYDGPNRSSKLLVGAVGSGALLETDLPNLDGPRFPTQFLSTPQGVIIMPSGSRAFFYDGKRIEYLGFESAPGAPTAMGPSLTTADTIWTGLVSLLHADFGYGRLGTVSNESGNNTLLRGAYEYVVRWKDHWGNLSPLSSRCNAVTFPRQVPATATDPAEQLRPLVVLLDIERGPRHTKGRDIGRTRDLEHKGTTELFALASGAGSNISGAFATIPDNGTTRLSDNAPDSWLSAPLVDTDPMPQVLFGFLAFGRAFYADAAAPGVLVYTLPGRYGTPAKDGRITADPNGGALRGGRMVGGIALVWTETTTFIIEPYRDNSPGFRCYTLHPTVGCVGPAAMDNIGDGSLVWLARDGFYRWTGEGAPERISAPIDNTVESLNAPRLRQAVAAFDPVSREFRCWVTPSGSIENTLCLIYDTDEKNWRRRDGEAARSVCVTQDHRQVMLVSGYVSGVSGVWVLDHDDHNYTTPTRTYLIRTGWLATPKRTSKQTLNLFFREGFNAAITVNSYRDYRSQVKQDDGKIISPNQPEDTPATWNTALFNATGLRWVRRRITQPRTDVYVPSATAAQFELTATDTQSAKQGFEFVGLGFDGIDYRDEARKERA